MKKNKRVICIIIGIIVCVSIIGVFLYKIEYLDRGIGMSEETKRSYIENAIDNREWEKEEKMINSYFKDDEDMRNYFKMLANNCFILNEDCSIIRDYFKNIELNHKCQFDEKGIIKGMGVEYNINNKNREENNISCVGSVHISVTNNDNKIVYETDRYYSTVGGFYGDRRVALMDESYKNCKIECKFNRDCILLKEKERD
ncbi:hypothetical protein [Clostridium sp. ZBS4]|uniref:hypothetical protein n=1 Tax=Clostridium sp. ZBS4 TaxID=2949974 RepID=UPI00207964E4|nr:hypothetical protein [Clostridium sp. ZBS4]